MDGLLKLAADGADQSKTNKKVYKYLQENYPDDCLQWAKDVEWKLVERVPLDKVKMARRPGGAREQDKVKNIAKAIKEGEKMDPVVLVKCSDGTHKIADGYHRTLGTQKAEKKHINAWVAEVPEDKGPWDKEMHEKKLNVGKPALKKEASGLLGLLGLAGAVHVAPNLLMKAIKSTDKGHDILSGTFSAGVDMAREGKKLHPNAQSLFQYGIGPESLVDFQLGQKLGKKLREIDPEKQERFLQKARSMGESAYLREGVSKHDLEKVPVINTLVNYMEGRGENKVKKGLMRLGVPEEKPVTWKNKAGNLAMLGGAAAVEPHLLMQPAISGARKTVAQSKIGQGILNKQFHKGRTGEGLSKVKEVGMDLAVSPSVLDPYRVGKFINDNAPKEVAEKMKDVNIGEFIASTQK